MQFDTFRIANIFFFQRLLYKKEFEKPIYLDFGEWNFSLETWSKSFLKLCFYIPTDNFENDLFPGTFTY